MLKRKVLLASILVLCFVVGGVSSVYAWESPMVITPNGNSYYKPEIGFAPTGDVYVAYRQKDDGPGDSEIMVCHYDGKTFEYFNVSQASTIWDRYKCYESDIEVTADGRVHVAWMAHNRATPNTQNLYYRYLEADGTMGPLTLMGEMHLHAGDVIFDLRLGVDNSGNVHVVLQEEHQCLIRYFAKYGDTILPMEAIGTPGARLKHPDIAVDDNYVHMTWMKKVGYPYVIVHQKRENKIGGAKSAIRQITFPKGTYASQKSRIDLDSQGFLHHAEFYKTGTIKKLKYYVEQPNGSWSEPVNVSSPTQLMLYHWAGLEVRDNSVIATMQLGSTSGGSGLFYNWKRNGVWGGYAPIPDTGGCVHTSVDLSVDGAVAGVVYARNTSAVMLAASEPIVSRGLLEADFSFPGTVFYGDSVTFDASACGNLNPDTSIVNYTWEFGDGSSISTSSPITTHSFNSYGTDVTVKLTITNADGYTGSVEKTVTIKALYTAILGAVNSKSIRTLFYSKPANEVNWTPNPKNASAGFPAITKYSIYRAAVTSSMSASDYIFVGEADASKNSYLDYQGVKAGVSYTYVIVSVDAEGHVSPLDNF